MAEATRCEPRVECGIVTCSFNSRFSKKYGYCESPKDIVLKFKAYLDTGQGGTVFLECLNQTLPQSLEE
jgi:hypothetical protein